MYTYRYQEHDGSWHEIRMDAPWKRVIRTYQIGNIFIQVRRCFRFWKGSRRYYMWPTIVEDKDKIRSLLMRPWERMHPSSDRVMKKTLLFLLKNNSLR